MTGIETCVQTHGTTVRVSAHLRVHPHLNHEQTEHGAHHDNTRHRGVVLGEQVGQAGVRKVKESCGQKLRQSVLGGNENEFHARALT